MTSITIPENVEYIGDYAFASCYFMTDAFVNNSAQTSEDYWGAILFDFETSDGLLIRDNNLVVKCRPWATAVTIPNSVTSIGASAFRDCIVTSITIPNSVTSIGASAFYCCRSLTDITIGSGVTSIGEYAFRDCSGLTSVTIGSGVTSIGEYVFNGCRSLTDIIIPNSVTSIGKNAFESCSGLTSVTIGSGVTSIGEYAFRYCSSLTDITIPNSVTSIGKYAFYSCSSLTSITIGNGVTSIGEYAFRDCSSLRKIRCYAVNVPQVNSDIMSSYNNVKLVVPAALITQYKKHSIWKKFTTIISLETESLTLDENSSNSFVAGLYETVTLKRTFKAGWNTLCLPFAINDVEGFLGEGAKAYALEDYVEGELFFTRKTLLDAGKPYVVYVPTAITEDIVQTNVNIKVGIEGSRYDYETEDGWGSVRFWGTYNPIAAGEWEPNGVIYGLTSDGYIRKAGAEASIKAFRAYFDIDNIVWIKGFRFDDMEDAIVSPFGETEEGAIYNLAGQRQNKMQKGINIINGKKILK